MQGFNRGGPADILPATELVLECGVLAIQRHIRFLDMRTYFFHCSQQYAIPKKILYIGGYSVLPFSEVGMSVCHSGKKKNELHRGCRLPDESEGEVWYGAKSECLRLPLRPWPTSELVVL